jgi:hypothetical protein
MNVRPTRQEERKRKMNSSSWTILAEGTGGNQFELGSLD